MCVGETVTLTCSTCQLSLLTYMKGGLLGGMYPLPETELPSIVRHSKLKQKFYLSARRPSLYSSLSPSPPSVGGGWGGVSCEAIIAHSPIFWCLYVYLSACNTEEPCKHLDSEKLSHGLHAWKLGNRTWDLGVR